MTEFTKEDEAMMIMAKVFAKNSSFDFVREKSLELYTKLRERKLSSNNLEEKNNG